MDLSILDSSCLQNFQRQQSSFLQKVICLHMIYESITIFGPITEMMQKVYLFKTLDHCIEKGQSFDENIDP